MTDHPLHLTLYQQYQTDPEAEAEGRWVEFRPGIRVRIRSTTCDLVRTVEDRLAARLRPKLMANNWRLPPKDADAQDVELLAQAVVVAWDGVTDAAGAALVCTPATVRTVMTALPAFRREVLMAARLDETFRVEVREALEGN